MRWTEEQDERLRTYAKQGYSAGQAGKLMGFSRNSMIGRAHRLGEKFGGTLPADPSSRGINWTPEDDEAIRAGVKSGKSARELAVIIGQTHTAVSARAYTLGVRFGSRRMAPQATVVAKIKRTVRPISDDVQGRPWLTRVSGECAYLVSGEGAEAHSCCQPIWLAGYCETHARMCFQMTAMSEKDFRAARAKADALVELMGRAS